MPIVKEQHVTASNSISSSITTPTITAAANNLYVIAVTYKTGSNSVSSVTGGSLTWSQVISQCSGKNNKRLDIWKAYGSPGSDFTITVNFSSSSLDNSVIAARYSGTENTGATEDPVGQNTNGESGSCTGGTNNATTSLTTGSTVPSSMHFVASETGVETISAADTDYTEIANVGSSPILYCHQRLKTATGDDTCSHTMTGNADWTTAGMVIKPPSSFTKSLSAAITPGAGLKRLAKKKLAASLTTAATHLKKSKRRLLATLTANAELKKGFKKTLSAALTAAGTLSSSLISSGGNLFQKLIALKWTNRKTDQ